VTDTAPVPPQPRPAQLSVLSVAELLARSIENVFVEASVSSVFAGLNELF
jgi:phosphoribosylpyrophosphate synthetase